MPPLRSAGAGVFRPRDAYRDAQYPVPGGASAEGLARYTQTVLQGSFVLAKAEGGVRPVLEAIAHLKAYLALLFRGPPTAPMGRKATQRHRPSRKNP